jgi:hypothetical protein
MRNETPDAWIERRPEDNAPDPEDCCPVCGTYDDCVCPEEEAPCYQCGSYAALYTMNQRDDGTWYEVKDGTIPSSHAIECCADCANDLQG